MNASPRYLLAVATAGVVALSGCAKSDRAKSSDAAHAHAHEATSADAHVHPHDPEHEHEHDEENRAAARFEAGHGLELAAETVAAIGLTTASAERRALAATTEITATVFAAGTPAQASALVPLATAEAFATDPRVLAIHRDTLNALGQVELVLAAPGTPAIGATLTLELRTPARETLSVPSSAVLRTATGIFVYAQRGEHWARTAVSTGATDGGYTAITAGLAEGDRVAVTAAEHLWLTELRLTKGGGHSH